ncbi:hypothetical protein ACMXYV_02830 [Neptuniibacter sp. SY11_33]|uniref:hypothetical protein n=1 Tax=Neptuniibacter sp. SY11_33 TaxID=3398215 RepID=UPI0039F5C70C
MDHKMNFFEVELPLPNNEVDLAGFYPPRKWNGKGGGLLASFLSINLENDETLLLGAFDVLFIDSGFKQKLQDKLGDSISIVLVASHTHSAPALANSVSSLGVVDEDWQQRVIDVVVKAIKSQCNYSGIVRFNYASKQTSLNVNRRKKTLMLDYSALKRGKFRLSRQIAMASNFTGVVDNEIKALSFLNSDGEVKACIWCFGAHPVFHHDRNAISPDFPGVVRQKIKARYGDDCISIFLPGLAGSAIPNCKPKRFLDMTSKERLIRMLPFHSALRPVDEKGYAEWGEDLANQVVECTVISNQYPVSDFTVSYKAVTTPPIFNERTKGGLGMDIHVLQFDKSVSLEITNGELLSEWVTVIEQLPSKHCMRITSGYGAGACLYIPPNSEVPRGGYEVERFKGPFGLDGDFIIDIDEAFISGLKRAYKED